jgi:hypothetical protein
LVLANKKNPSTLCHLFIDTNMPTHFGVLDTDLKFRYALNRGKSE